jgi:mono/diheme cytochrome c family protein
MTSLRDVAAKFTVQTILKILAIALASLIALSSCDRSGRSGRYSIKDSKTYEATLYRQNCAICHGPEAEGKLLPDGKQVPSLREGQFKFKTESELYDHIANGGNGMTPFRNQLTDRELKLMAEFVRKDLRGP